MLPLKLNYEARQELATRENMQDHGQLFSPSPAVAYSPVIMSSPSPPDALNSTLANDILDQAAVQSSVIDEAEELGRKLSETVTLTENNTSRDGASDDLLSDSNSEDTTGERAVRTSPPAISAVPNARRHPPLPHSTKAAPRLAHPSDISAQLYSNPAIAALRPGLSVVPTPSPSLSLVPSGPQTPSARLQSSSPILINPKCSGYFVEPVSVVPIVSSRALIIASNS